MAATGFTPVYLYASGTAGHIPLAANLTNTTNGSEIALNYADGNLFFKNASNSVITTPLLQSSGSQNGWLSSTDWTAFNGKQAALVSGTNIKTVGGVTLLGSGDVSAPTFTGNVKIGSGAASNAARLLINNATNTATGTQVFQDGIESWVIGMDANSGIYKWKASNSTKLELNNSTGDLTVDLGNLVIGTSGKGIDFSATPGTGTSELLADYEEGTWTPSVSGGSGTTYTTQDGWYTKTGNLVTAGFELTVNAKGTITGNAAIAGLPYTSASSVVKSSGCLSYAANTAQSTVWQGIIIGASQTILSIYTKTAAGASTQSVNGTDFFQSTTQLIGTISYHV